VHEALVALLGAANLSHSRLASGLTVWRSVPWGTAVTAGPEDHSGLAYLSFSDGRASMLVALDSDPAGAARYIAARLAEN